MTALLLLLVLSTFANALPFSGKSEFYNESSVSLDVATGIGHTPAAIGHLGEGTGRFSAEPSWANAGGVVSDVLTAGTILSVTVSALPSVSGSRAAAAAPKKIPVNELPSSGGKFVVDSKGNTIYLKPGETFTSSPDGKWIQVRGPDGKPTGLRLDGPHKPSTHQDPIALQSHGHVPGVTNPDGTPWLPLNK